SSIVPENSIAANTDARTDANDNATAGAIDTQSTQNAQNDQPDKEQSTSRTNTQGNRPDSLRGVNDSTVRLPFNLDYNRVPVMGSYAEDATGSAYLESAWFELPEATEDAPLLVTSVAGRIAHKDINGVEQDGT
ncbi:arabinosyltransferase, partial [Rhizobium leguminosarum]|nr:arabinosyltransferase [Rhizobium ruizarguesonis]